MLSELMLSYAFCFASIKEKNNLANLFWFLNLKCCSYLKNLNCISYVVFDPPRSKISKLFVHRVSVVCPSPTKILEEP